MRVPEGPAAGFTQIVGAKREPDASLIRGNPNSSAWMNRWDKGVGLAIAVVALLACVVLVVVIALR